MVNEQFWRFSMKPLDRKTTKRFLYAVPVVLGSSALIAAAIAPEVAKASTPNLPQVSPTQLLSWVNQVKPVSLSGTVTATTSFPIPSASVLQGSNAASALSGSSTETYNVWENGQGSFRSQQKSTAGETDLYVTPSAVWLWNSKTLTATKEALPTRSSAPVSGSQSDPQLIAGKIVQRLSGFSTLSVSGDTMVAGRPAYTLSITPKVTDSLVGSINIAVDSQTHIPVQIQVLPKGSSSPAVSIGFQTLSFGTQQSSIFSFSPPPGAKVIIPSSGSQSAKTSTSSLSSSHIKVVGTGFDSIAVISAGQKVFSSSGSLIKSLPTVTTSVGTAHLYANPIMEALILPNGTVIAGAVTTQRLVQVADGL